MADQNTGGALLKVFLVFVRTALHGTFRVLSAIPNFENYQSFNKTLPFAAVVR